MSFQPVIPVSGLVGWRFLQRTYETQLDAFAKSPALLRDSEYFSKNIAKVKTSAQLVSDPRLLRVALGAFGLSEDVNNRYFIQKILDDGTADKYALANRLSDDRYRKFSAAFGFGPLDIRKTDDSVKMTQILELNRLQSFEQAVGRTDDTMRIALYARRELAGLAQSTMSADAKWFTVMGLPPLREMFETALALPKAFGQIDIDKQLEVFRDKSLSALGDKGIEQFSDPEKIERFTDIYLARAQIRGNTAALSGGSSALMLLRGF